ncbi:MAG: DUF885 family protein [Alphaproteobacteria bacterium]
MLSRREILAGGAVSLVLVGTGSAARADAAAGDAAFRALIDRLAATPPADETPMGAAARRALAAERLAALAATDPKTLSPAARLEYGAITGALEVQAALARFEFGAAGGPPSPYVVSQRAGTHLSLSAPPSPDKADGIARDLDGETERIRADAAKGVVAPAYLLAAWSERLGATRAKLADTPKVADALARQIDALESLKVQAGTVPGVWRLKHGADYYALALRAGCGLATAPAKVHRDGIEKAAALAARADRIFKSIGMSRGGVGERLHALARLEPYLYADSDAGRAEALADMNAQLARAIGALPRAFAGLPHTEVSVKLAGTGRQGYREAPSADGIRPGAYYVDLRDIRRRPRWSLPTVVHHETLPGHLLQMALQERAHAPALRLALAPPAYFEGWAIYAEMLAGELGLMEGDPLAELGLIQSVLVRLARQIVDTGIHHLRWSRQRAIAEFATISGDAPEAFEVEVDRISVQPGLTPGHALGWSAILDARARAKRALGGRFSLAAFHDAVLRRGALPLGVLGSAAEFYISEAKARLP